jgi:predicted RNA binding protein YcfA (HicA-like mRNA interferase family)
MPNPREHERFCKRDGWERVWKKGKHHKYYRKVMPDGTVKETRISHGNKEYSPGMWRRILKKQLQVTQEDFNRKK